MLAEIDIAGFLSSFFFFGIYTSGKAKARCLLKGMSDGEESVGNSQTALGVGGQDWIVAAHFKENGKCQ